MLENLGTEQELRDCNLKANSTAPANFDKLRFFLLLRMTTTTEKLNLIYFIKNYRKIGILEITHYEKKIFLSLQTAYSNVHSPKTYIRNKEKIDLTLRLNK